jgi:hypothetical protein
MLAASREEFSVRNKKKSTREAFQAGLIFTLGQSIEALKSFLHVMRVLKQSIHYGSTALSTHGISTLEIFDGRAHVGDCHVQIVVL